MATAELLKVDCPPEKARSVAVFQGYFGTNGLSSSQLTSKGNISFVRLLGTRPQTSTWTHVPANPSICLETGQEIAGAQRTLISCPISGQKLMGVVLKWAPQQWHEGGVTLSPSKHSHGLPGNGGWSSTELLSLWFSAVPKALVSTQFEDETSWKLKMAPGGWSATVASFCMLPSRPWECLTGWQQP